MQLDQLGADEFQVGAHRAKRIRQPVEVGKAIGLGAICASLIDRAARDRGW